MQEEPAIPTMERPKQRGTTAWKIRIDNGDLFLLKQIAEKIAEQDRGLIPKPTVTALIQKSIKNYIAEALRRYRGKFPEMQLVLVPGGIQQRETVPASAVPGAGGAQRAS